MPRSPKGKEILYVKVASLGDLCRYCCNFDYTTDNVFLSRKNGRQRIIAFGETIGNTLIAYYTETNAETRMIRYTMPDSQSQKERAVFVKSAEEQPSHYLSLIEIDLGSIREARKLKKGDIATVRMADETSLINAVIKKSMRSEMLMHLYAFGHKGNLVLGAFELIDELTDDIKTFYYTLAKDRRVTSFARYDYINNKVDFTNTIGEHSYMYTKIISLAEPLPFFKPD